MLTSFSYLQPIWDFPQPVEYSIETDTLLLLRGFAGWKHVCSVPLLSYFLLPEKVCMHMNVSSVKKCFSFSLIIGLLLLLSSLSLVFHKLLNLPWNGTEKRLLPLHCEWSQSEKLSLPKLLPEVHSHSFLFGVNRGQWIPERPGSAVLVNTDETPAPLSLREAVEHPLLSHTLQAFRPAISYLSF